jgi:hypothetical protein
LVLAIIEVLAVTDYRSERGHRERRTAGDGRLVVADVAGAVDRRVGDNRQVVSAIGWVRPARMINMGKAVSRRA